MGGILIDNIMARIGTLRIRLHICIFTYSNNNRPSDHGSCSGLGLFLVVLSCAA